MPILYIKFDESSGTIAHDTGSGGNDAELMNGAAWTTGRVGGALRLDGINDHAYIGTTSNLDIYQSITIAAWINPSTVTRKQDILCKHWQSSNTGYEFGLNSAGELMFRINPTDSTVAERFSSGASLAPNVWQHVAATYDGTSIRFYKNGALISTVAAGGRLYPAESDVFIGVYESGEDYIFSGMIDEVRLYDRSLTTLEINQLYSSTPGTTTTSTTPTTTTPQITTTSSTTTTRTTTTTSTTTSRATTTTTTTSSTITTMSTTTSTSSTRTTTTTTRTTTTTQATCRVGLGYTFSSIGTYTANSASGVASISRSGQYTFYETPHDYVDLMNCPWSGTYTCPAGTNIRFYLRAQTEEGYDYFSIRNSAGTVYEEMSGDYGTTYAWTDAYSQRTASFNFASDQGTLYWGIDLYQIGCVTTTTTTTTRLSTTTTRSTTTTIVGECFGAEDCNPTGNPIGGGSGYSEIITTGDYVARTESEVRSALNSATSGQVVFIPSGVTIDLSGKAPFVVKAGVTLASDRGNNGAKGALIKKTRKQSSFGGWAAYDPALSCGGDNVRITGLQMEGEMFPSTDTPVVSESEYLTGILQRDYSGMEVDNCELRGFAWASVFSLTTGTANIHHNYIHYSLARSEGYGVEAAGSYTLIEANIFDNNRHSIAWGAGTQGGYEARYNIHLGHGTGRGFAHFDIHEGDTGGGVFRMHHNTFEMSEEWNIVIQGEFGGTAYIDHNVFNSVGGCGNTVFSWAPDSEDVVAKNYCGSTYYAGEDIVSRPT